MFHNSHTRRPGTCPYFEGDTRTPYIKISTRIICGQAHLKQDFCRSRGHVLIPLLAFCVQSLSHGENQTARWNDRAQGKTWEQTNERQMGKVESGWGENGEGREFRHTAYSQGNIRRKPLKLLLAFSLELFFHETTEISNGTCLEFCLPYMAFCAFLFRLFELRRP